MPGDGVDACYRAVLNQMALRGILKRGPDGQDVWRRAHGFKLYEAMRVYKRANGEWLSVTLASQEEEAEEERLFRAQQGQEWLHAQ